MVEGQNQNWNSRGHFFKAAADIFGDLAVVLIPIDEHIVCYARDSAVETALRKVFYRA